MEVPPEALKHLVTEAITIPCAQCSAVRRAIALDAEEVPTRVIGIDDRQIDAVAATAHLSVDGVAQTLEHLGHIALDLA